nr:retrovirus-related Pol polyprotein from transposon TNT 1-94 [Tanacetum cinerariifolium]
MGNYKMKVIGFFNSLANIGDSNDDPSNQDDVAIIDHSNPYNPEVDTSLKWQGRGSKFMSPRVKNLSKNPRSGLIYCSGGLSGKCTVLVGKENGVNILKSIDEGPFQMGTFRETLVEVTKNKRETIHDYYVRFAKLINNMQNIKMTMSKMQLNSKFVNNMLLEWSRFVTAVKLNIEYMGTMQGEQVHMVMGELKTELGILIQVKQGRLSATTAMVLANGIGHQRSTSLFHLAEEDLRLRN